MTETWSGLKFEDFAGFRAFGLKVWWFAGALGLLVFFLIIRVLVLGWDGHFGLWDMGFRVMSH